MSLVNKYWELEKVLGNFGLNYYPRSKSQVIEALNGDERKLFEEMIAFKRLSADGELSCANAILNLKNLEEGKREAERSRLKHILIDSVKPMMAWQIIAIKEECDTELNFIDLYATGLEAADHAFSKYLCSKDSAIERRISEGRDVYASFSTYFNLWFKHYVNNEISKFRKENGLNLNPTAEKKLNKLLVIFKKWIFSYGTIPTIEDLMDETGLSREIILDFQSTLNCYGEKAIVEKQPLEALDTFSYDEGNGGHRKNLFNLIKNTLTEEEWYVLNNSLGLTTAKSSRTKICNTLKEKYHISSYKLNGIMESARQKLRNKELYQKLLIALRDIN